MNHWGVGMAVLTIHALDAAVEKRVRARARKERKSLNQTLKELLAESVGAAPAPLPAQRAKFAEFSGVWSKADGDAFAAHTADLGTVDPADWQ
ncbi:MAG: hypothetical protein WC708_15660 [Lentisphaeria bacterium]